ncbi:MAG: helix-turn-helix transcriptional regulator [Elusimicrobia bacterium]|nr:helix-turn-helix transcriptional regulator [Elusimicrobiota bacterium]
MFKEKTFFSKQLKKIMFEKNLTQKDLATKLGIEQQMISFWVTARRNPTTNSIKKIATALNVPVSYFLGGNVIEPDEYIINIKNKIELLEEKNKLFEEEISFLKKEIKNLKKNKS